MVRAPKEAGVSGKTAAALLLLTAIIPQPAAADGEAPAQPPYTASEAAPDSVSFRGATALEGEYRLSIGSYPNLPAHVRLSLSGAEGVRAVRMLAEIDGSLLVLPMQPGIETAEYLAQLPTPSSEIRLRFQVVFEDGPVFLSHESAAKVDCGASEARFGVSLPEPAQADAREIAREVAQLSYVVSVLNRVRVQE